jgi:hypothetical protein
LYVVERIWRVNGEANENDVAVWVGERSQPVVIFLARRIPQGEFDVLSIDLYVGYIVLEHGRNVDLQ